MLPGVGGMGHPGPQLPHQPPTWIPSSLTFVEHHAPSFGSKTHSVYSIFRYTNGNTQGTFGLGPPFVLHSIQKDVQQLGEIYSFFIFYKEKMNR